MNRLTTAMVIASNRAEHLEAFLRAWREPGSRSGYPWDVTVVVEDGPSRTFDVAGRSTDTLHYSWAEIDSDPEVAAGVFSRRDSAIRTYGFWKAWRDRDVEAIVTLDDDCLPPRGVVPGTLIDQHLDALSQHARWVPSIPGMPTRGMPYMNLGSAGPVSLNMGLWDDVADYDAPQSLAIIRGGGRVRDHESPRGTRLMHPATYWPLCGMNLAFRAEILPLMYFPKMGEGCTYGRFDDIWCGVILQRCARHLNLRLSAGDPVIHHTRASSIMVNLEKEAPGIRANEEFWRVIESVNFAYACTPLECVIRVANRLKDCGHEDFLRGDPKFVEYLHALGSHVDDWHTMFRNAGWPEAAGS